MKPDGTANGFPESFRHALEGVAATARGRNFRVQLAAGAVLLFSFASAVVGAIVFLPRLATLVRGS